MIRKRFNLFSEIIVGDHCYLVSHALLNDQLELLHDFHHVVAGSLEAFRTQFLSKFTAT